MSAIRAQMDARVDIATLATTGCTSQASSHVTNSIIQVRWLLSRQSKSVLASEDQNPIRETTSDNNALLP
jgi:hypothetical protein